jgi:ATP-binding cassette subfamily F protein uup
VDEYLQRRAAASNPAPVAAAAVTASTSAAKDQRAAQKDMSRIERRLDKISSLEKDLHDRMAEAATDYEKVAGLDAELRELTDERERLEEEWLTLAD